MDRRYPHGPQWWLFIVRVVGGVHMMGPLWVIVHDLGLTVAWRQIERLRLEFKPRPAP